MLFLHSSPSTRSGTFKRERRRAVHMPPSRRPTSGAAKTELHRADADKEKGNLTSSRRAYTERWTDSSIDLLARFRRLMILEPKRFEGKCIDVVTI